jgi:Predicted transcriptional regulators
MANAKTKYVILGLLSEHDLTGYEIKKIIDMRFSFFWNESYGQIYPELKRMVAEGLICEQAALETGKRRKTAYAITPKGKKELISWLMGPTEKETVRFELLLKMYFSSLVDAKVIQRQIGDFLVAHEQQLSMLNMAQKELQGIADEHANHQDILRIIDFGQKVYTAYIEWCRETIAYLEKRDSSCKKQED